MDVKIQYVDPVKEDLVRPVISLATEIRTALALLSGSAPPLEGLNASVVEKMKEGEEVFAQKEETMVTKLETNLEFEEREELDNSDTMMSFQDDVNEKGKISDIGLNEKLTSSLKLVSAMKGSRGKQGMHAEKLSVSWAADVYDPPVTSQSHSITDDNQHGSRSSKKSYKNKKKHKGKSSSKNNNEKKKGSKTSRNSSKVSSY